MPAPPKSTKDARVRVSSTLAGTYTNASMVRTFSLDNSTDNGATLRYMGGESEVAGDPTGTGTIGVWWDADDTTGQTLLRTSYANGTPVYIQYAPVGTATGAKVRQMGIIVTGYTEGADIDADAIEETYNFKLIQGSVSTVTLA